MGAVHAANFADILTYAVPVLGLMRRNGARGRRPPIVPPAAPPAVAASSGPAPPTTPLTIISSVSVLQWVRSDLGVTVVTGVSAWLDQTSNHRDFSQGTGANQPTYSASDATLNSQPTLTFDGSNDALASTSFAQADPVWIWMIVKQVTWGANRRIWCANQASNTPTIFMSGVTPNVAENASATANANSAGTLGSWFRTETLFSSSTSDYIKIGPTTVTGASAGATTIATGVLLGGAFSAGVNGNIALAEYVLCAGKPSGAELTALDAYVVGRYGAGLT